MATDQAYQFCADSVREADKDRFLATLFAPAQHRPGIFALYAFDAELAHVRDRISAPLPGEVRLQYWRDVLTGTGQGDVAGNPVAAALCDTIRGYGLPVTALLDLIDARTFDLYDDPMATVAELERYSAATAGALLHLEMQILMERATPDQEEAARQGGLVESIVKILQQLPAQAARGQCFIPHDVLQQHGATTDSLFTGRATPELKSALEEMRMLARRRLAMLPTLFAGLLPRITPAVLPLTLAPRQLQLMERPDYDPFRPPLMPQWRRQWILWRAAKRLIPYLAPR